MVVACGSPKPCGATRRLPNCGMMRLPLRAWITGGFVAGLAIFTASRLARVRRVDGIVGRLLARLIAWWVYLGYMGSVPVVRAWLFISAIIALVSLLTAALSFFTRRTFVAGAQGRKCAFWHDGVSLPQ